MRGVAAILMVLALALAGCGGDDAEAPEGPVSPGQALVMTGQTVTVRGYVVQEPGVVIPHICTALAESFPPRCSAPSLPVEGYKEGTLQLMRDPETKARWSKNEVELRGRIRDGALIVS
jgi:hypothetical protein